MKKYYLAYGSNLNIKQMKSICPYSKLVGKSLIPNYRLVFKGTNNHGYLTIEKSESSIVPIGIYEITNYDEHQLDLYENFPVLYLKENISVYLDGKIIEGIIYIMNPYYSYELPNMEYIKICKEGYNNFGFNPNILSQALKTTIDSKDKKLIK